MMLEFVVTLYILSASSFPLSSAERAEIDALSNAGEIQEYCLATAPFQAKCLRNEVIIMTSALYGRMKMGRCLEDEGDEMLARMGNDPRFLGCSVDVLQILDRRCSGRNQCDVKLVSDPELQLQKPCLAALKSYLEASYDCVTVIEADRSCHVTVSSNPLHIMRSSSSTSALLNCGTKTQPWVLEAPAGQQINVSLLDFGLQHRERGSNQQHCSQQYGYIVDKAATKPNVSICGLGVERSRIIYQSKSNVVELVLQSQDVRDSANLEDSRPVMLGLTAVGCSNVVPPEDAWLRRSNNEAVVGCYSSRQSWHLRCVDNVWVGVIGNCSREMEAVQVISAPKVPSFAYQVLLPVAVGAIGLIVCIVIIVCGVVCLRRYSAMIKGRGYINYQEEDKLGGGARSKPWHGAHSTQHAPLNGTAERAEQMA